MNSNINLVKTNKQISKTRSILKTTLCLERSIREITLSKDSWTVLPPLQSIWIKKKNLEIKIMLTKINQLLGATHCSWDTAEATLTNKTINPPINTITKTKVINPETIRLIFSIVMSSTLDGTKINLLTREEDWLEIIITLIKIIISLKIIFLL